MEAPLLPKFRGYFAEFLKQGSLYRLRILSQPTRVGLRYGHQTYSLRGFSWKLGLNHFVSVNGLVITSQRFNREADLPTSPAYRLEPGHPAPGWSTLLRHPFTQTQA